MPFRSWLVVALLLPLAFAARDCAFQPILKGVSTKQSLGETQKRLYTSEADCKQRCLSETQLNCTAFLWGGSSSSDCYLLDKVDLQRQIFVDQRAYLLYVEVCDGEPVPSIGYCQFLLNKTNVAFRTDGKRVSPGRKYLNFLIFFRIYNGILLQRILYCQLLGSELRCFHSLS